MKIILSDYNNNVDISKLSKTKLNKLLKETKTSLKDYIEMLQLPLTEDEQGAYFYMVDNCRKDIKIIEDYILN